MSQGIYVPCSDGLVYPVEHGLWIAAHGGPARVEAGSRIRDPGPTSRAPSPESRAPSPESRAPSPESRAPSPESRLPQRLRDAERDHARNEQMWSRLWEVQQRAIQASCGRQFEALVRDLAGPHADPRERRFGALQLEFFVQAAQRRGWGAQMMS